jgi:glutamine synthetase
MTTLRPRHSDRELDELAAGLAESGVAVVAGSVTDLAGVTRGKYVPTRRLPAFARSGMGASPSWSVFCVDSGIAFTPSLGVAGDLRIRIDPDAVRVIDDGVAWAPGELHDQDGAPVEMCPRALLARTDERTRSAGRTPLVGVELECTVLAADGSHATTAPWSPYGIRTSLDLAAFLVDLARTAESVGLPVEQLHTEYGHDQLEVSLAPLAPVAAADAVVLTRVVLGRVAARHGLAISFSPVPFAGEAGNGAHLHLSLAGTDRPLFSGGDGPHGLTDAGGSAIAGILATLPELLGLYAGSALSAARLQPGNWAGAAACWGLENREAAVRFIAGTPGNPYGANVELKVVDPSANPYLAVAAMLGSADRGIEAGLPLPDEVPDNPSELDIELPSLPTTQVAAIDALEASAAAAELLGAPIVEGLVAVRRHEISTYGDLPLEETTARLRLAWSC